MKIVARFSKLEDSNLEKQNSKRVYCIYRLVQEKNELKVGKMDKKSTLEAIECHMIFGEIEEAEKLKTTIKKENDMIITRNQTFEGTLIAAGWDQFEHINQLSLYTPYDEDILLEDRSRIQRFAPYMNQKVRIVADVTSSDRDGRRIAVKKITKLVGGFSRTSLPLRDEFNNLIPLDAA